MHITIKTYYRILFFLVCFIIASSSYAGERFESSYHCLDSQRNCSDVKGKWVEGVYVEPKCWEFQYIKTCAYPSLDDCARLSHCYFVQIVECLLNDHYGACVNQKKEFSCKRWVAQMIEEKKVRTDLVERDGQDGLVCKGVPCIDGNCVDKSYDTNGEMMDSVSKLYAGSQMKGDKDLNFKLFEGTNMQCSKKATSYSNCCSENLPGWGRNLGSNCTQDERTLIENRKKNLCVYVGKQNKQTLGISTLVKHQFCCFGNMLDKVIQVEGRKQLNGKDTDNFGSGSNPDCRGLTLQEIQRIDFSRLDFSEFIEDFKLKFFGKYKTPNTGDLEARVNGSMSDIRKYDDNPHNKDNNLSGWKIGFDDSNEAEKEERRLREEYARMQRERELAELARKNEQDRARARELAEKEERERIAREEEEKRILAEQKRLWQNRKPELVHQLYTTRGELTNLETAVHNSIFYVASHIYFDTSVGHRAVKAWEKYKYQPGVSNPDHPIWQNPELAPHKLLLQEALPWIIFKGGNTSWEWKCEYMRDMETELKNKEDW